MMKTTQTQVTANEKKIAAAAKAKATKAANAAAKAAQHAAVVAPTMYATIGAMLSAHGLIPAGNCSSHKDNGRTTTGNFKSAEVTATGKAFFANRSLELQGRLKDAMAKATKAKAHFEIDSEKFAYVAGKAKDAKLSHAPINPGSYQRPMVRAWFAIAIQHVKTA